MLYFKLHKRGYSKTILARYFLKFCDRYPIDVKYNSPDGKVLWSSVLHLETSKSCCVYDYEAIDELVKPCKVVLDRSTVDDSFLTGLGEGLSNYSSIDPSDSSSELEQSDHPDLSFVPQSLPNPKNHCYINSCLQVIYRIFMHYNEGMYFNNNREGCLIKCLVDGIYSDSGNSLVRFKEVLARFDDFFSGQIQQDVSECFNILINIFHSGTKQSILCDDLHGSDDLSISLSKRLFLFNFKNVMQCLKCRLITHSYSESYTHIIYPIKDKLVSDLMKSSLVSKLEKLCVCCGINSTHDVIISLVQPPEVLVLIVSRFHSNDLGCKNSDNILVDKFLNISSSEFSLIGTIHHHGRTIAAGHYTCNIFYPDSAYVCNDSHILPLNHFENSDSVYMLFYMRK